jgi:segregation and condensation protein B
MGETPSPKRVLEALLFVADEPLTVRQARRVLPDLDGKEAVRLFEELRDEYEREERSFRIVEIEKGYQMLTRKEYFPWIQKMRSDVRAMRLSRAAVETLAIIAYRQPVTRSTIEHIRGVDVGGVLRTLLDRDLVTLKGRAEGVGRPLLYGTTDHFLNHFGLKNLSDLPKTEELTEIMKSQEMEEVEAEVDEILGPALEREEKEPDEEAEPEEEIRTAEEEAGEEGAVEKEADEEREEGDRRNPEDLLASGDR